MFLQRFKYTDHYYTANIWCSRKNAHLSAVVLKD